jgi:hypothetical protein
MIAPPVERGVPAPAEEVRAAARKAATRRYTSYILFTLCAVIYLLPFMRVLREGTDEGSLLVGAVRIIHGQLFARDFFEVIGPGTFYWLALSFKIFGVSFAATRICLFITSLGTSLLMYFLSRRVCERYFLLPCVLLAGIYYGAWPAVNHHEASTFFALLSFACIVLWQDRQRRSLVLAAGALAGVTTCFLQPKGILLLVAMMLWLWLQRRRRQTSLSALRLLLVAYCSVVGVVLIWFWSRGALWDLIYANFLWPQRYYGTVNTVPYAQGLLTYYWNSWVVAKDSFYWIYPMAAVMIVPFLFLAALPALLLVLGTLQRTIAFRPQMMLYWLCGSALWLSEIHRKDIYHLVFASPILIILCVYLLSQYRAKIADLSLQVLVISVSCLLCFNLFLALITHPIKTRVGSIAMFKEDAALTFVSTHTVPGEEIFSYPYSPVYYFLTATKNPTRYSILLYNYNTPAQFHEVIQTLDQHKVKYVVWDTKFQASAFPDVFPSSVRKPPDGFLIESYLESHYNLVESFDGVRIMERKSEDHSN